MGSWTQKALGGGGWASNALAEDELPEVGVTLEGLDADAAAADQARFKPWSGPEQIPATNNASAGAAMWGTQADPNAGLWESMAEGVGDFGQRAAMSATMGYGDEIVGALGGDQDAVRNRVQLAKERSPGYALAGDIAGGAAIALPTAAATGGLGLAGRLAAGAGLGAQQAAVSASGYADDGDRWEAAQEALGPGAAMGMAGELGATAVQGAGNWARNTAAPWLREQGLMNRVASSGLYGGSMDRLAQNVGGKEGIVDLGQWMENNDLTQWTPGGIGEEAKSLNSMRQGDQRYFLDDLNQRPGGPPLVDTGDISDQLRAEAVNLSALPDADSVSQGVMYGQQAKNIVDKSQPGQIGGAATDVMPFEQAWRARQGYDKGVDYNKLGGSREDALYEGVARDAANGFRGGLVDSLENTSPDLAPRWESIQEDLGNSSTIMKAGQSRELRETGNQPLSLPALVGAAGGGFPGMAAAAAVKTGGRAGLANVEGGLSRGFDSFGTSAAGPTAGAAEGAGKLGAQGYGRVEGEVEGTRGYMLPQAALDLMRQPGALGKWEKEFFDAANSNDTHALSQLIVRLSHTDDEFSQTILPQLKQLTATGF